MRSNRTLPLARSLAVLAAISLSGCVEELVDAGSGPIVEDVADTGLGLAADGREPEDTLEDAPGDPPDSVVHPTRARIELTISTTSSLQPNTDVVLTVKGVAREAIDSGEVVLTLPTRALMDHVIDTGVPELPAVARWELPAMTKGGTWSGTHTVPGEAAGWYRAMANAYTHGPDGGMWLSDDAIRSAWMHVHETDGRLASFFDDGLLAPVAGPAAGWPTGAVAQSPDYVGPHPDSTYLHVVYSVGGEFRNAVGATVEAREWGLLGPTHPPVITDHTVPEDGIVAFYCWRDRVLGQRHKREMWGFVPRAPHAVRPGQVQHGALGMGLDALRRDRGGRGAGPPVLPMAPDRTRGQSHVEALRAGAADGQVAAEGPRQIVGLPTVPGQDQPLVESHPGAGVFLGRRARVRARLPPQGARRDVVVEGGQVHPVPQSHAGQA